MNERIIALSKARSIPLSNDEITDVFGVFAQEEHGCYAECPANYCRRDLYRIALIRGENRVHYGNKSVMLSGVNLVFFSPNISYTRESLSDESGYLCFFKEAFYARHSRNDIKQLPMFAPDIMPTYQLSAEMDNRVSGIFEKMLAEMTNSSPFSPYLSHTYVSELIYLALTLQPVASLFQQPNAKTRLTKVFVELLERQFNGSPNILHPPLKRPNEYALQLNVHINHLNDAVKKTTGKTTTRYIAERISLEAQIMLRVTQLNISEIGYLLGFREPAHFYNFFRKINKISPSGFRSKLEHNWY